MSTFVALLDAEPVETRQALLAALHEAGAREATPACGRGLLHRLLRRAPNLVLLGGSEGRPACLAALAYRRLRPRSRLLLWLDGPPPGLHVLRRLALRLADGALLGCGLPPGATGGAGARLLDAAGPHDVLGYAQGSCRRGEEAASRIAVAGHLSLDAGGLELLGEVAALCERHPARHLHLDWIGEGELRGVLEAQLLPSNLHQRFYGTLDPGATARLYRRCGALLSPRRGEAPPALMAAAMASGLVVLFDAGCPAAAGLLGDAGIGLDPSRPGALSEALGDLLARPALELDRLRALARGRALATAPPGFEQRVARAVRQVLDAAAAGDAREPSPLAAPGNVLGADAAALPQAVGAD